MEYPCSVAIDFDGTVTDVDVIDEILRSFAPPEWRAAEELWERGVIGSRQCLKMQMGMIREPLHRLLSFVDDFTIDPSFGRFCRSLQKTGTPFAIVSDGFQVFINRLLGNAGLKNIPVLANVLTEEQGRLKLLFPYFDSDCASANCKCGAVAELSKERALIVIGDGRSDFCLADKAAFVYAKNKLSGYCRERHIPHADFARFAEIQSDMQTRGISVSPLPFASGKD